MPYVIRHDGAKDKPYCIYHQDTGKRVGCTTSQPMAKRYLAALYVHETKDATSSSFEDLEKEVALSYEKELEDPTVELRYERDQLALMAVAMAQRLGYQAGLSPAEGDTLHATIDLPGQGQASFMISKDLDPGNLPEFDDPLDGHTFVERDRRIEGYLNREFVEHQSKAHNPMQCMECSAPPTHVCVWAEGAARTWLCDKHYAEFKQKQGGEINAEKKLAAGEDPREFKPSPPEKKEEDPVESAPQGALLTALEEKPIVHITEEQGPVAKKDSVVDNIFAKIMNIIRGEKPQPQFFTFKEASGRYRWVSVSSTAFKDRDTEIVSKAALETVGNEPPEGPLLFWHEPSVVLGNCDFHAFEGVSLIESGLWAQSEIGKAAAEAALHAKHPWAVSIKFLPDMHYVENDVVVNGVKVSKVWNRIQIKERSILPENVSSNLFSWIETVGGTNMDARKKQALEELLGPDLAGKVLSQVKELADKAKDADSVVKETEVSKTEATVPVKEPVAETQSTEKTASESKTETPVAKTEASPAPGASVLTQEQLKEFGAQFKSFFDELNTRMDALDAQLKANAESLAPRAALVRPTTDASNVAKDAVTTHPAQNALDKMAESMLKSIGGGN
jgi:hypothetical protein